MKKRILVICLFLGSCGAFAEQSGAFIGIGVGFHNAKQEMSIKMTHNATGVVVNADSSQSKNDANFALILGYKNMFKPHSGVRFYLNYDHNLLDIMQESGEVKTKNYKNVGINGDYLYNFSNAFGLFAGAHFGAISWDKQLWSIAPNKDSSWFAHFAVQLGLRGVIGRHSLELGVKVPLTSMSKIYTNPNSTELNNAYAQQGFSATDYNTIIEVKLKQQYNAFLRYVFSF